MKRGFNLILCALLLLFISIANVKAATEITSADFATSREGTTTKGITFDDSGFFPTFTLASGEYKLAENITLEQSEFITIAPDTNVVFDLNGKTLAQGADSNGSLFDSAGNLAITGNGKLTTCVMNYGDFSFSNNAINVTGGNLSVQNGTFNGGINVQDATAEISSGSFGGVYFQNGSTGIISGGTFNEGVSYTTAKKLTIKGGTFVGTIGGLSITVSSGKPTIEISGGTFKATGSEAKGAIFAMLFDGSESFDFSSILADGYKYSTSSENKNEDGESPGEKFSYLVAKETKVVKETSDSENNDSENTTAENVSKTDEKEVSAVTDSLINEAIETGKETKGISSELAAAIKEASDAGQVITSKLTATPLTANDLSNDVKEKVAAAKSEGAIILGYFDVQIQVLADGTSIGNITELNKPLKVTLDTRKLIASLPKVATGKKRVFKVVTIHNGKSKVLDLKVNSDNTSSFENDEFSDYIITYEDVDAVEEKTTEGSTTSENTTNPETLDNISLYIILSIISIIGLGSITLYKRLNN